MRSRGNELDEAAAWQVACPRRPSRVPGVAMAGFRDRRLTRFGHRVIPRPAVTLVLDFGAGPAIVADSGGREHRGSLIGSGFGDVAWVRGEDISCVQVRLSPVTAARVLGAAPADLHGTVLPLPDLWGREASRIGERLVDTRSWEDRFALVDGLLADRYTAGSPVDREIAWAWGRMVTSNGLVRIERLAADLGWSRKRLWSRFRSQLGLPPKRAAKLIRFDHASHLLAAGRSPATVAADGGYADQSHLHRDVLAFTGITPAALAGESFLTVDDIAWAGHVTAMPAAR